MDKAASIQEGYISEKLQLLEQILDIAKTQMDLIEKDLPGELQRSMRQRERILRRIDKLTAQMNAQGMDSQQNSSENGKNESMRQVVKNILAIDEQCAKAAQNRLSSYKTDIKTYTKCAIQLEAYANPYSAAQGLYVDKKN